MWGGPGNSGNNLQERITDNWIQQNVPGGLNSPLGQQLDNVMGGNPNPTFGQTMGNPGFGRGVPGPYGGGYGNMGGGVPGPHGGGYGNMGGGVPGGYGGEPHHHHHDHHQDHHHQDHHHQDHHHQDHHHHDHDHHHQDHHHHH